MRPIYTRSIDEILGSASTRFFGDLYRSAQQQSNIIFEAALVEGKSFFRGVARVEYPLGWGEKNGTERVPHLSTIDAILFLAQVGGAFVKQEPSMASKSVHMTRVRLRAGSKPDENLNEVPIVGVVDMLDSVLRVKGSIGGMRASAEFQIRELNDKSSEPVEHITAGMLPEITLDNIQINPHTSYGRATMVVSEGLSEVGNVAVLLATFIAGSQIAQALVSVMDGISRDKSDTLWMRRYESWIEDSAQGDDSIMEVNVEEHALFPVDDGQFSVFNGHGGTGKVRSIFSIAHMISGNLAR